MQLKSGVVFKKKIRTRKDNEIFDIDGKKQKWGDFKNKFFKSIDEKE
jgi:hypothetical protein